MTAPTTPLAGLSEPAVDDGLWALERPDSPAAVRVLHAVTPRRIRRETKAAGEAEQPSADEAAAPSGLDARVILYHKDLKRLYGWDEKSVWRWERTIPDFPKRIKITEKKVGWYSAEIEAFLTSRKRGICGSSAPSQEAQQ